MAWHARLGEGPRRPCTAVESLRKLRMLPKALEWHIHSSQKTSAFLRPPAGLLSSWEAMHGLPNSQKGSCKP